MSFNVTINGTTYALPSEYETNWAAEVNNWMTAVSTAGISAQGGAYPLQANLDLTNTPTDFGIIANFLASLTNPAHTGLVRLANNDVIAWRSEVNTDLTLAVIDGKLTFNGIEITDISSAQALTNKTIDAEENEITNLDSDNFTPGLTWTWAQVDKTGSSIADLDNHSHTALTDIGVNTHATLDAHLVNVSNPHSVTKAQVLAAEKIKNADVDAAAAIAWTKINKTGSNLTDLTTKSHTALSDIGTNTHAQIDSHIANTSNPHAVTKAQVLAAELIKNSDVKADAAIDGTKISPVFGNQDIVTEAQLQIGQEFKVHIEATPTEDYTLNLPLVDGVSGQALVKGSGPQMGWASIPGLALNEHNVAIGGATNLPSATDTSTLGDILASSEDGFTIKPLVIDDADISNTAAIAQSKIENLVTDLAGKQAALGFTPVPDTRTVNGHSLTSDVTLTPSDIGLGNVPNVDATDPDNIIQDATHRFVTDTEKTTWSGKQDALGFTPVAANAAITAATNTKITYDTKGLVTSSAQAATSDLSDIAVASPTPGQVLTYNGTKWVNGASTQQVSAGAGINLFFDDTTIKAVGTNNVNEVVTLLSVPNTSIAEVVDSISLNDNTVLKEMYLFNTALGRTQLDAGEWELDLWSGVNSVSTGRVTTATTPIYRVIAGAGTLTVTGSGTSRTATASTGTPFAAGDANANLLLSGWLMTPQGLYRITGFTSSLAVTIATPTTYVNESAVAFSTFKYLFPIVTEPITSISPAYTLTIAKTTQAAITVSATDKLAVGIFGTSNDITTLSFTHNGTARYSFIKTPLVARHNDLAGLQGGSANEYYHLTQAQATIATQAADSTHNGYLTSTDWTKFNTTRYVAALSWTGAGPYTMTILGSTHGRGVDPQVIVRETAGGSSVNVWTDVSVNNTTGDVLLTASSNISGKVIIL